MFISDKGYTIVEMLIAMAIVGIVIAGIYNLVISSSRTYLEQNATVEMQSDGRAAMDFMTRELRQIFDDPTDPNDPVISTGTTADDTISFNRVEDTGYSSGGNSTTTLNDTRKSWDAGRFKSTSTSSFTVWIISGPGTGQRRTISNNSSARLTLSTEWTVPFPDDKSVYVITINKGFTRTSASDNVLRYRIGATGTNQPLAENITKHRFSKLSLNTIRITLTARASSTDPNTKQYREYTLTEDVSIRNM